MPDTLGSRIRALREGRDLSLREFAKRLGGISAAHISDIELGRRFPSDHLLQKMVGVLGVAFNDLKSLDQRPPAPEQLKRAVETHPVYGALLRQIADQKLRPEDVLKLLEKSETKKR